MEDIEYISTFFDNYFPLDRSSFVHSFYIVYIAVTKIENKNLMTLNALSKDSTNYILGHLYSDTLEVKRMFKSCLEDMFSVGIDWMIRTRLNPFDEFEDWRVTKKTQEALNAEYAKGNIIYFKQLENV